MTTLTATTDGAAVTLTLTPSASITGLTRTDANGTAPVRVPAGTFPRSAELTVTDWEASLRGTVTYRAGNASVTVALAGAAPVLVAVLRPAMSRVLDEVTDYTAARVSLGTVHQVVDRPDPLVSLGRLGMRTGTLRIWTETHGTARELENLADRSGVLMLKQAENAGQDLYFVVLGSDVEPDRDGDGWGLTLNYQEIARPTSPVSADSWTFADVSRSFPSFRNVSSSYADFELLSLNDSRAVI